MDKHLAPLMIEARTLPDLLEAFNAKILAVTARMDELRELGLIYATGRMREGRYYTLIYPQKNGVRPSPKYVGTDKAKILQAEAGIARAKEYEQLASVALQHREAINQARYSLSTATRIVLSQVK